MNFWFGLMGRRSRVLAGAVLAAGISVGDVQAQELHPWSGFYAGIHGGYHWGGGEGSLSLLPNAPAWGSPDYEQFQRRYDSAPDGALGGAQLGFNWRAGTFIVGLEADISRLNADGEAAYSADVTDGGSTLTFQARSRQEMDWLGTLRARIGVMPFADQRLFIYLTGGLAYAHVKTEHSLTYVCCNAGYGGSASGWEVGGTVGGGVEWAIGGAWTLKAEYLYYDLSDRKVAGRPFNLVPAPTPEFGADMRYDLDGHIARVGLNYQLGGF